ncbi:MAG: hypothetical protein R2839_00810 [Thermomicrobiales bacterium]
MIPLIILAVVALFILLVLASAIKVVKEYERAWYSDSVDWWDREDRG